MPFHWYYLQFHSRVGSAARQLKAFPASQSMWKAWAHPLWLGGEVWFRHYCHSQVWRLLVCVYTRIDWENSRQCCPQSSVDFLAFFVVLLWERGRFFGLHLPACPLDSCSVCQLVASGTLRREAFCWKKREGSSRDSASTPVFLSTSTVLQHSKEIGFPYSLSCSFC